MGSLASNGGRAVCCRRRGAACALAGLRCGVRTAEPLGVPEKCSVRARSLAQSRLVVSALARTLLRCFGRPVLSREAETSSKAEKGNGIGKLGSCLDPGAVFFREVPCLRSRSNVECDELAFHAAFLQT